MINFSGPPAAQRSRVPAKDNPPPRNNSSDFEFMDYILAEPIDSPVDAYYELQQQQEEIERRAKEAAALAEELEKANAAEDTGIFSPSGTSAWSAAGSVLKHNALFAMQASSDSLFSFVA